MEPEEIKKYKPELKAIELNSEPSSEHKKINCTSCGNHVPADHININDKIAKCSHCNIVFSFQNEIGKLLKRDKTKQEVIRPEGIDIFYFQNELDISIRQPFTVMEIISVCMTPFFAILLSALLIKGKITLGMSAFGWFVTLLTIGYLFFVIGNLINRPKHKINLSVSNKFLSIKWRPNKFHKDRYYPVHEIDQIYVKNFQGQASIYMITNSASGQKHVPLITGIDGFSKARYIEQEIEYHLSIEDREVPEESV